MQVIEGAILIQRLGLIDVRIHNCGDAVRFGVTTELESMGRALMLAGMYVHRPRSECRPIADRRRSRCRFRFDLDNAELE